MRINLGYLAQILSLLGLLGWVACTGDKTRFDFQPITGTLIVQSSPEQMNHTISPKQIRHLGRYATVAENPPIIWVTGKDTIVITPTNGPVTGIRVIEIDSTAKGLEDFINTPQRSESPFTVVVSPLGWNRTVQLHQARTDAAGELWICRQSNFKRDGLQLGADVLISPGNDRKYIFKIELRIISARSPLTEISATWFKQEQLRYTLSRASQGGYPQQPVVSWAPNPTLLSFYQAMENQIDSLRTAMAAIPNTMILNLIPF